MSLYIGLLKLNALTPSFSKTDGIKHGESGATKGRKVGISGGALESLLKTGRVIKSCSISDGFLDRDLSFSSPFLDLPSDESRLLK